MSAGNGQILTATFAPSDTADYTAASATVTINVAQATPVISCSNPSDIVYGTALSDTQLTRGSGAVQGRFSYGALAGTVLSAGNGQTLTVTFTPYDSQDYATVTTTVTINVIQATPTISWWNPADIVYGTPLRAAQLNATASVAGTFAINPPAGTVLNAGIWQTLSVTFIPDDSVDYTCLSTSVNINVAQATPTITWQNPADIVYGTPLDDTQFNATANVEGTFCYSPARHAVECGSEPDRCTRPSRQVTG